MKTTEQFQCRYQNCIKTFNYYKKRNRHESKHKIDGDQLEKEKYPCTCCDPPHIFESAKDRCTHKYYQSKTKKFECPKCGDALSSKQRLETHISQCCMIKRKMKAMQKFIQRRAKEVEHGGTSDEEDKHSSSDEEEESTRGRIINDDTCQRCDEPISDESPDEWWCNCGYGLCADCRSGLALDHLYRCPTARKRLLSKRTKKNL